ncbi:metallophosphoesterase [Cytophagaceae bacterium DM2B3-1]|uniref:Metallophosphoesterase n=1 Tax=Xanthocytophaga flava TaxID=3048013 RepID=A0ABT7CNS6_9BACT|nr:metallophosphoesterase [Xanthocytophaga flavus]MDJ1495371.1 metallophosphoesterase [Xanthocytophaga flavus]
MKLLAIGDIHGRTIWKKIVAKERADRIIFLGDYFDSREDITCSEELRNFESILSFKEQFPEKVVLLFGNHDLHYIINEQYSGFRYSCQKAVQEIIHNALQKNLMQMCFSMHSFLFSHAGVTKTWYQSQFGEEYVQSDMVCDFVNKLFRKQPDAFRFTVGPNCDFSGDDITQPPTWVRPASLLADKLDGYIQIVGHTTQTNLAIIDQVAFADTLGTSGEYLTIEDELLQANVYSGQYSEFMYNTNHYTI